MYKVWNGMKTNLYGDGSGWNGSSGEMGGDGSETGWGRWEWL